MRKLANRVYKDVYTANTMEFIIWDDGNISIKDSRNNKYQSWFVLSKRARKALKKLL